MPAVRKAARILAEFTILPFENDAGQIIGIAAMLRDLTRRFEERMALRKRIGERSAISKEALDDPYRIKAASLKHQSGMAAALKQFAPMHGTSPVGYRQAN